MEPYITVADAIDDLPAVEAGERHPNVDGHIARNHRQQTVEKYEAADIGDKPHGGHSPRVLDPMDPSFTVVISDGKTPIHYEQPRMLTPRECARLQDFPDDHVFTPESRTDKCRLVGNAVPVGLAESIAESL